MPEFQFGGDIVWRPSAELIAQSRLKQFMDRHDIGTLAELQRRSTENIEWFWDAVMRELGIEFYQPYERIVDLSRGIALAALVRRRKTQYRPQLPRQAAWHSRRTPPCHSLGRRRGRPSAFSPTKS